MKSKVIGLTAVLWLILSVSCNLPGLLDVTQPAETERIPTEVFFPGTGEEILQGGGSPAGEGSGPCGYTWAVMPLLELTEDLQDLYDEAGMGHVRVWAEAFGENCVLPDGTIDRFLTMQTDVRFSVAVTDLTDYPELAVQAREIIRILSGIPRELFPGPMEGKIALTFTAKGETLNFWFDRATAHQAMQSELESEEFLEALRQP